MVQREVKPTRMELIDIRKKIFLSERGYKLLKMKRDGLVLEFFKIFSKARDLRAEIIALYKKADERLTIARCIDGETVVSSAAFAVGHNPTVVMGKKNVMGVVVPTTLEKSTVKRRVDRRGYGIIGASVRVDEAADAYETIVERIILAAELETTLKRLIDEIETTKRKVNALEFKIIPELKEIEAFIRLRLEELERENVFRLKRIKHKSV
ncbi:MAG: V-type ATP synthase subunit D [Euryarchaeota archaeon]|nr:V-type ATP synthase subunit D [Euryarchaeota archaeon]